MQRDSRLVCRFFANLQVNQKCAFSLTDIFSAGGQGEKLSTRWQFYLAAVNISPLRPGRPASHGRLAPDCVGSPVRSARTQVIVDSGDRCHGVHGVTSRAHMQRLHTSMTRYIPVQRGTDFACRRNISGSMIYLQYDIT